MGRYRPLAQAKVTIHQVAILAYRNRNLKKFPVPGFNWEGKVGEILFPQKPPGTSKNLRQGVECRKKTYTQHLPQALDSTAFFPIYFTGWRRWWKVKELVADTEPR